MRINILHTTHFFGDQGGAEKQLHMLANFYISQGHSVNYICPIQEIKNDNVLYKLECLGLKRQVKMKRLSVALNSIRLLLRAVNNEADVYITRTDTMVYRMVFWYTLMARKKHVHFLASNNDMDITVRLGGFLRIFKKSLQRKTVICQNDYQLVNNDRSLTRIIKITQLVNLTTKPTVYKNNEDVLNLAFVGNLKKAKRPDLLLEIAEGLEKSDGIRLRVVGRCPDAGIKDRLSKYRNTEYLGELSNNSALSVLSCSHALINLSDFEGFSNTFLEAWSMGCLVISRVSNPDGIITKFNLGYVIRDIDGILECIHGLKYSNNLRERSDNCVQYVLDNHTLTSQRSILNSLLEE